MPIRLLAPDVAACIAAGEVIERPASVVKELLENALDAGARAVAIEVLGGGVRMVRVADDGSAIPAEEVELAFQRHATSKISRAEDLDAIITLGFRGEALPTIAAVAEVAMVTRTADAEGGTYVLLQGGHVAERGVRACSPGTVVTVRNLFRNLPARLKFLKSDPAEAHRIVHLVTQYALAYPEVRFTLQVEGRATFSSTGSGDARDALARVFDAQTAAALLEVTPGDGPVRVSGYVSPPSLSRASRTGISLFVNRRWVQSRTLTAALEQGCEGMLMTGRRPIAVVHIHLPLEDVDVNVHPAKAEVRFRREGEAFAAVRDAVRQALLRQAPAQSVALPAQAMSAPSPAAPATAHPLAPWDAHARMPSAPPVQPANLPQAQPLMALPILRPLGQVASTYVIAEGPDGVYLIDQHAAHERVLFERLREQRRRRSVETQGLLEPAPVEVSPAQEQMLQAHREELEAFGFALEPFGERTYLVRSIPAAVQASAPVEALREVLELLGQELPVQREDRVAFSLACHGAIRAGKVLLREEMEELLRLLEQTEQPHTCPHGRPTMVHLSAADLERQFGRR
ncbi:MAG: DNA mismatch repair endonuclease MutL [Dehalococcoidia bacterium]|nr:DNA mismatch repair endonuclease MutL [Dehalococcoidia bacterium]